MIMARLALKSAKKRRRIRTFSRSISNSPHISRSPIKISNCLPPFQSRHSNNQPAPAIPSIPIHSGHLIRLLPTTANPDPAAAEPARRRHSQCRHHAKSWLARKPRQSTANQSLHNQQAEHPNRTVAIPAYRHCQDNASHSDNNWIQWRLNNNPQPIPTCLPTTGSRE